MCRLFESIRLENGIFHNLPLHEERMIRSVHDLFQKSMTPGLAALPIPVHCMQGLYKCRVVYGETIDSVEFIPYTIREIQSVRLVISDEISYSYKFTDRSPFAELFNDTEKCDEIIILKKEVVTDSSFSNLAFLKGDTWYTPVNPLLEGVRRKQLIREGRISSVQILAGDLAGFTAVSFINAMLDLGDLVFPVGKIQ